MVVRVARKGEGVDKDLDKMKSHQPVDWEMRIEKMENTWQELYHKLVVDYVEVKKVLRLLRTILHTWLPIIEKDNDDMEGTI